MVSISFIFTVLFACVTIFTREILNLDISVLFKMLASTSFVLTAIFSYLKSKDDNKYFIVTLIFFGFSWLGDLFLGLDGIITGDSILFEIGVLTFAAAHFFLFMALSMKTKLTQLNILIFLSSTILCIFITTVVDSLDFNGLYPLIILYAIIISAMLSKALGLVSLKQEDRKPINQMVLGAVLFALSDYILMFWLFLKVPPHWLHNANTILYFLGQAFIAISLTRPIKRLDKSK